MRKLFTLAGSLVALTAAVPVAAQPAAWSAFDPARAQGVADRLVLCDMSEFLASGPDLDAQIIYVRRDDQRYDPLIPPFAGGGASWYEDDLQRAYQRFRRAGLVTSQDLAAAQDRYVRPMSDAFEHSGNRGQRHLQGNARFCRDFARSAPR